MPEAETPPMPSGSEDCVPLDALSMPDEKDQMQPPTVGDRVDYSKSGILSRIEGGNGYVTVDKVNGQDVAAEAKEQPVDEMASLESMAANMPKE